MLPCCSLVAAIVVCFLATVVWGDLNDFRRLPKVPIPEPVPDFRGTHIVPYVYNTSKPFALCVTPKSGTTRWIELLVMLYKHEHLFGGQAHNALGKIIDSAYLLKRDLKFANTLDRVVIARNPFARFISSYFDHKGRYPDFNMTLMETIDHLLDGKTVPLMNHMEPQTNYCGHGHFEFDFILRVEEMCLWYDDFVAAYELTEYFAHGWPGKMDPFYKPSVSLNSVVGANMKSVLGIEPWVGGHEEAHGGYSKKSELSFLEYYKGNPELVAKVFKYFEKDFTTFSYPAWDGKLASFRIV
jgi:hypothetical protein